MARCSRREFIHSTVAAAAAGGALGAALFTYHQIMGRERTVHSPDSQYGSYLGPALEDEAIINYLDSVGAQYTKYETENAVCEAISDILEQGNVVGHCEGRMEFGPRALGTRSILGDPRNSEMQTKMNVKIKFRESFRPFAPICLEEKAGEYFDIRAESPYMLIVAPVHEKIRLAITDEEKDLFGIDRLKVKRSELPAITHVDYSARVQTVNEKVSPRIHKLLSVFEANTGCGVLVNTSFNIRGEPIVCTAEEAYRCFMLTDMDALVLNRCVCLKEKQPEMAGAEEYKRSFKLD